MGNKRAMMIGLDGADPMVCKRLVAEGKMPNLKKILEQGVATESMNMLGVLPTITPPNWATLATGNYPRTHGVTCFMNHTIGKGLDMVELNWDSRRIESELIWEAFEDEGKKCILLNYCEAWPNRVEGSNNIFVDGTGVVPFLRSSAQYQKVVFMNSEYQTVRDVPHTVSQSTSDCVVYGEQAAEFKEAEEPTSSKKMTKDEFFAGLSGALFKTGVLEKTAAIINGTSVEEAGQNDVTDKLFTPLKDAEKWAFDIPEGAKECTFLMNNGLERRYALITGENYDTVVIYKNKKDATPLGSAKVGEWTAPILDTFTEDDEKVKVAYYIRNMEMNADGTEGRFYISHVLKTEDDTYFYPKSLCKEMMDAVGPMCYHATVDRHTAIGDSIELESFDMINDWHMRATDYLFEQNPDWQLFYIHLHSIDLINHHYIESASEGRHEDWKGRREIIDKIYEINDKYLGTVLKYLDEDTCVAVCSDHGAIPRSVGCENPGIGELTGVNIPVMEQLGYTKVLPHPDIEGYWVLDLEHSRAVQHRTSHVYINLKGRDPHGIVEPEDYEELVQQIISDLYNYRDPKTGKRVVAFCMTREEMETIGMGGEHCGDIFFQLTRDFGLDHGNSLQCVSNDGYSLDCLCVLAGCGLKKGETIARPIRNVDIVPTLCHLVGNRMPKHVEGGVIYQALAE